jgi:hypothetical protein
MEPVINSEGTSSEREYQDFVIDITCVADEKARQRILSGESVLVRRNNQDVAVVVSRPFYDMCVSEIMKNHRPPAQLLRKKQPSGKQPLARQKLSEYMKENP